MEQKIVEKAQSIIDWRNKVGDRIDSRFGAFTPKAMRLHDENRRRMSEEIKKLPKKE